MVENLKVIMYWFGDISGLVVNDSKSKIMPIGEVENMEQIKSVWRCNVGMIPTNYLGAPPEAGYKCRQLWIDTIERFR